MNLHNIVISLFIIPKYRSGVTNRSPWPVWLQPSICSGSNRPPNSPHPTLLYLSFRRPPECSIYTPNSLCTRKYRTMALYLSEPHCSGHGVGTAPLLAFAQWRSACRPGWKSPMSAAVPQLPPGRHPAAAYSSHHPDAMSAAVPQLPPGPASPCIVSAVAEGRSV